MEKYYLLKLKKDQDAGGSIIGIKDGKLERFAGDPSVFKDISPKVNKGGTLSHKRKYYCMEISKNDAEVLGQLYDQWISIQNHLIEGS